MSVLQQTYLNLCQRLRQFGRLDAGRLIGSTSNTHGGYRAWMDLFEKTIFMRAECNALGRLFIEKGLVTQNEWLERITDEAAHLFEAYASQWPEIEVDPEGRAFTIKDVQAFARRAREEGWPP